MPHVMVDPCGIRPVRLDGDETKSLPDDQFLGDALAHPVELAGAMGGFAEQHHACRPDPLQQGIEIGGLDRRKRFRGLGKVSHQRFVAGRDRPHPSALLASPGGRPSLFPDQWHEADVGNVFAAVLGLRNSEDPDQFLTALIGTDRDHQPAANLQLPLERLRNFRSAGGDDNSVVGRVFRPPFGAVGMQNVDIVVAEIGQRRRGLFRELAETFDRVHIGGDLRQHRGGIPGACADLKHLFAALQSQGLRHEGDDVRLGNRLLAGDRER